MGKCLQALINFDANILRSRYLFAKGRNLFVERAMIKCFDHFPLNEWIEVRQIRDHSRSRIHRP